MLVEKEIIGPGAVWYNDLKTGEPRKYVVTPALTKHWCERGNEMLSLGLTVPVPCEHDFEATPLTPADKLKNNAGWVSKYLLKDDKLFGVVDVQDEELYKKLPTTIRWTSPYFSSFTDGAGRKWDNVVSHLALTTRPRIVEQAPFPSVAAAMTFALTAPEEPVAEFSLSGAGMLKLDGEKLVPEDVVAFSLYSGVALSEEETKNPLADNDDDMSMDKLLCDLLCILGINMPASIGKAEFKRALYQAATLKIKELSTRTMPAPTPAPAQKKTNPIVQEQQPMYMSLEDIEKIEDKVMKGIALSMYNENVKLRGELEANTKATATLRDAKLKEENAKRASRVALLGKLSPKVKADLDALLVAPAMALSMGEGGEVLDPMAQTLNVLEKGLSDMPALLKIEQSSLIIQPQPTDSEMTDEETDKLADSMARSMGCPPEQKKAG